jgi:hypothetical protein
MEMCSRIGDKNCGADGTCECVDNTLTLIDENCVKVCYDYTYSLSDLSWDDAKLKCETLGGQLASARNFTVTNLHNFVIDSYDRWVYNTF